MNTASTNTASNLPVLQQTGDTGSALDYDYQSLSEGSAVFSLKWDTPNNIPSPLVGEEYKNIPSPLWERVRVRGNSPTPPRLTVHRSVF